MESRVGVRLFDRGREGAFLTDAGRSFMHQAADILALAENMEREMAQVQGINTGQVHVGGGIFAGEIFLAEALASFARHATNARVRLNIDLPEILIRQLRQRDLAVIVIEPIYADAAPDITQIALKHRQGYLVVRKQHPLLDEQNLTMNDVVAYPLATMPMVPNRVIRMGKHLSGTDVAAHKLIERWVPAVTVNSVTALKTIVADSDHVMVVSLKMVHHELERKELALVPLFIPWLKTHFAVLHLARRTLSPSAQAVVQAIIAEDGKALDVERGLAARWFKAPAGPAPEEPTTAGSARENESPGESPRHPPPTLRQGSTRCWR